MAYILCTILLMIAEGMSEETKLSPLDFVTVKDRLRWV
jgi:hypothetical protein